ncbi:MAG: thioredoxin [Rhodanobacteraceae bacterium]|nr:thioredoxin [Rhodanobacteraceae bacterium]
MSDAISQLGSSDFEASVLKSDTPVLVDFWAEWCEPCKRMEPLLQELAGELTGKLKVAKVNVEAHPAIANQFRVRGLPTFMLFKNGQVHSTQIGAISKSQLAQFVAKAI